MAEIIHSTTLHQDGPWLIERDQLLELDSIASSEWQKLLKSYDEYVAKEVESTILNYYSSVKGDERTKLRKRLLEENSEYTYRKERFLIIHLEGNRRVDAASFEEAFRDPALLMERPIGFTLSMENQDIACSLTVPYYDSSLKLEVTPDRDELAKGVYAALRIWVDKVKAPWWQTLWLRLKSYWLHWFLWIIAIFISGILVSSFSPDTSGTAREFRKEETLEIMRNGVSSSNYFKAIELILSYESGAIPSSRTFKVPSWFMWLLFGGIPSCIALSFTPSVILGIGKGGESIKKWRIWMRLIAITFPLWVVATFIGPKFVDFLQHLF